MPNLTILGYIVFFAADSYPETVLAVKFYWFAGSDVGGVRLVGLTVGRNFGLDDHQAIFGWLTPYLVSGRNLMEQWS